VKRFGRSLSYPDKLVDALIATRHIGNGQVTTPKIADGAVTGPKTPNTFIQEGAASVSFPFAAAGEENVSASVTFPPAFPTGTIPQVAVEIEGIDVGIVNISVTETGFTVSVRDDKGVDYTTAQTATVRWIAIAKS